MRILAFIDLHGSLTALHKIKEKAKKADIIVCGGDLTVFEQGLETILSELNNLSKDVLIIHGNHESEEELRMLCKKYKNLHFLHNHHFIRNDIIFFGWGGGGFNIIDKDFEKQSKKFSELLKNNKEKAYVLVTHAPPYGTKLDVIGRLHHGNKSFTKFIKDNKIDLTICGHLHENHGKIDKIGNSTIINPGPEGVLLNI